MTHYHSDDDPTVPASRTLAEVTPPAPHPLWLTVLATLGGLVIPAIAAIAAAILLGPPRLPHTSRAASLAAAGLTIAEAIFAGLGAAALVEAGWRQLGLPGSGPANFLPLRWIRHRIAHRNVQIIIDRLRQNPTAPSRDSLRALLDLSRELARRDIYTRAHSGRVSRLSVEVGQRIGLSPDECEMARLAGLLHDIGKLEIPASILNKPGPLDPDEAELVRHHPMIGAGLVAPYIGPDVVNAVRHHHERVDGAGYPDGVDGEALPVIARLVPVVDTYDALISDRAYRPGRSREEAFMELRSVAGTQLDSEIVEALIEVEKAKVPFGGALLGLAPVSGLVRRAEHLLHGSAAPAAAAVTAIAVAGAGWLGVMSNTAGGHFLASREGPSIVNASPTAPTDTPSPTDSPAPVVAATDVTSTAAPAPTDATGKTVAPLYFPLAAGKPTGKSTGTQGVLVTPPTSTKTANGQTKTTTPTTVAVGPANQPIARPVSNPTSNTSNPPGNPGNPAPAPAPPPIPPAQVDSVNPGSGPAGTAVTISGSNFGTSPQVKFGNTIASGVQASPNQINVTAPPGSGTVPVTVTGPGGANAGGPSFRYVGPSILTVFPLFGHSGGGTPVTIHGSNFNAVTSVKFGNATVAVLSSTNNDISVRSPSVRDAGGAEVNVCVVTAAGQDCTSSLPPDQQFDYRPNLTSVTGGPGPYTGGTPVTLGGTNLLEVNEVVFGDTSVPVSPSSDNQIVVNSPPWSPGNEAQVPVIAQNPQGEADNSGSFTYIMPPRPSVSGVSPTSQKVTNTAVPVTITGNNFIATSYSQVRVVFGTQAAVCSVTNSTSLSCVAPSGVLGTVDVVVSTYWGESTVTPSDKYSYTL